MESVKVLGLVGRALCSVSCFEIALRNKARHVL